MVSRLLKNTAACLLTLACLGLPLDAAGVESFNPEQKTEIEGIVKDYLINHPEILQEMVVKLQEKQKVAEEQTQQKILTEQSKDIYRSSGDFVTGNPDGDITVVEFFDYNCGWCKRGFTEIQSIVEDDKNVRLVLKEFPIFGDASDYAAKAALASKKQNKYWEFHQALFKVSGKLTEAMVDDTATAVGLDVAQMKKDMADPAIAETLALNDQLARSLKINGTPAFIIGDKLIPGYVTKVELNSTVEDVRKRGACKHC